MIKIVSIIHSIATNEGEKNEGNNRRNCCRLGVFQSFDSGNIERHFLMNAFHWQGQPSIFSKERTKSMYQHRMYAMQENHPGTLGAHNRSAYNPESAEQSAERIRAVFKFIHGCPGCTFIQIKEGTNIPKHALVAALKQLMDDAVISKTTVNARVKTYEVVV